MNREELITYLLEDKPISRAPHEGSSIVSTLVFAASSLLDSDITCEETEEMYANFHAESVLSVCSFVLMGLVRHASHVRLRAEEHEKKITLWITGRRRSADTSVTSLSDLLPQGEAYLDVMRYFMRENQMRFRVVKGEELTLRIDLPRFYASNFQPGTLTKKEACCALYVAMMAVAGRERPDFSVLQFEKSLC